MSIPKSFKLNGKKYAVKRCNLDKEKLLGKINYRERTVQLHNGKEIPEDHERQTFLHELVHGILYHMGEHDLKNDERFVDSFAQYIQEYEESVR